MSDSRNDTGCRLRDLDLERLSTQELEELLRLDARSQRDEFSNMDFIFRVLEEIEKRELERPDGRLPDVDAAWESFQKNYLLTAGDGQSLYEDCEDDLVPSNKAPNPRRKATNAIRTHHRIRRSILVATLLVVLGGSLVAQAAGFDVFGVIARWTAETFHFEITGTSDSNKSNQPALAPNAKTEYASLQEAVDAYGITGVVPTWWPDGFELTELKTSANQNRAMISAFYQAGTKCFTVNVRQYASAESAGTVIYEKDENEVTLYEKNGIVHYIMSNLDQKRVVWKSGLLECSISGDLTEQELKKMVDSTYEG